MYAIKIITAIVVGTLVAIIAGLYAPIAFFGAYAPDGPFGLYYGMSDGEMVSTALITVAIMVTVIPAGITLMNRNAQ